MTSSTQFQPTFVYFGRFASHKGLERLLDTFGGVSAAIRNARLLLLGNDWDGTLGLIREKIDTLQLSGRVRVATGLSDDDLRREIGQSTFFVSASQYEGFGLALVEALSAGLIPIANAIPSHRSIISRSGLGLLTDFSDAARAAMEIARFVEQCRARHASLRAAAMSASRSYSWSGTERKFREEYENVLGVGKRTILGVHFAPMQRAAAVDTLDHALTQQRPFRVAFANANTLTVASRDERLRSELADFLVLNDGIGVDIAGRLKFGVPFPDNLNGTDFVPHFLESTRHRLRIYLVGARPPVIAVAARAFVGRWPRHTIVGARDGFFSGEEEVAQLCDDIRDKRADLVLVGLGDPLQEHWIVRYGDQTGAKLLIGVGALFDFVSGKTGRAPAWMRRIRCEWIYRLMCEPRRLAHRYLVG
ncbi:MAG TPA: WecB/TagA/CpsF family glycosyltransferase, partial [Nitrospiraceae bacterium]|nr:WecB/TagA/CpsF family glycosyltransferase [Nitrospiraceae bacterium]